MLPIILAAAGLSVIGKMALDFLGNDIRDDQRERRAQSKRKALSALVRLEYQSRGHMLDLLTAAQDEAWAEIDLIRDQKTRVLRQIEFARQSKRASRDFEARNASLAYGVALREATTLLNVREHYWHSLIHKYSTKKASIVRDEMSVRKRLGPRFFDRPDFEEFVKTLPIPGRLIEARMAGLRRTGYRYEFGDGFTATVTRDAFRASGERWQTGRNSPVFVSQVNYHERTVQVDLSRGVLLKMLEKQGFSLLTLSASAIPIQKEHVVVGYSLDWRGVRVFLPARFARRAVDSGDIVEFRLVEERFDPYNLIATMM